MKNIFKDRRFKHGSLATVMTIGMVAVVVLVNIIFGMLADRFPMDVDLTSDKIFEVSDQTVNYMKDLKQEVTVTVLAKEDEFSGNNTYYNHQTKSFRNTPNTPPISPLSIWIFIPILRSLRNIPRRPFTRAISL